MLKDRQLLMASWVQLQVEEVEAGRGVETLQFRQGIPFQGVSIHCSNSSWSLQQHGHLFFRVQGKIQHSASTGLLNYFNVTHGSNLKRS